MSAFVKNGTYKASLTTVGRRSGREHSVWLRAVVYEEKIYFSRRNENSDWLKNALANPQVRVELDGQTYAGTALLVTDESLAKKISELKYPGEARAGEARIVLQINPN
ncbi:MAG: nitroreductase/quinone reductase family protein [Candidatus Nitrosotenuis sp.]